MIPFKFKEKLIFFRFRFQFLRLKIRWDKTKQKILESFLQRMIMRGDSIFSYFNKTQPYLLKEKQDLIDKTSGKKVIYFTFRTLHFLDWFAPIDLAIKRSFPERYEVFYIDFSSTLHRIGNGFALIAVHDVESRTLRCCLSMWGLSGSLPQASLWRRLYRWAPKVSLV